MISLSLSLTHTHTHTQIRMHMHIKLHVHTLALTLLSGLASVCVCVCVCVCVHDVTHTLPGLVCISLFLGERKSFAFVYVPSASVWEIFFPNSILSVFLHALRAQTCPILLSMCIYTHTLCIRIHVPASMVCVCVCAAFIPAHVCGVCACKC